MRTANRSDVGKVRLINEDRAFVDENLNGLTLAIVADGMGGHQAGDKASELAVQTIQQQLADLHSGMSRDEMEQALRRAIDKANETIYAYAQQNGELAGMGTTIVVVIVDDASWMIAHIGDSRAYKLSSEDLEQLTEDHSLVNELLKRGQITSEEAEHHPRKHVLIRALGTDETVHADVYWGTWQNDEIILICSDGLSGLVDEAQMKRIVLAGRDLEQIADQLVQAALDAGGDDNITVVLLNNQDSAMQGYAAEITEVES
ncbi:Stp1/IreP family PP2C-type Ser/Thr phosphatase [Marinicrinis sediminis]|uniref:Stp1/IreP family PP2C-type Ser/Thr phosphatase n=1 Tax=Marinicrinis sediminis TaxID=1652465 RepID=A0ABW5R7Y3_9BACL